MAYTIKAFNERMSKIKARRKEALKNVNDLHVVLQRGNRKTGANCWTVSLLPVIDCKNCKHCKLECYDLWHDLIYPTVIWDRCRNSAIHEKDPERYWHEINLQLKANYVSELRINVGGDLQGDDFAWVAWLAEENPQCDILFFTKSYEDINAYLDKHKFPKNVHPIMSAWKGLEMVNPHHFARVSRALSQRRDDSSTVRCNLLRWELLGVPLQKDRERLLGAEERRVGHLQCSLMYENKYKTND